MTPETPDPVLPEPRSLTEQEVGGDIREVLSKHTRSSCDQATCQPLSHEAWEEE